LRASGIASGWRGNNDHVAAAAAAITIGDHNTTAAILRVPIALSFSRSTTSSMERRKP
jgi:hypothetical protein